MGWNAKMKTDFVACNALIYNEDRDLIANVKILEHDRYENSILIKSLPVLNSLKRCELMILTAPAPYIYKGTIHKTSINQAETGKRIRLFNENITENRSELRYKINSSTSIDELIFDGRAYRMHTQMGIQLMNISRSGVRFRAKPNAFTFGNRFQIRINTGGGDTVLLAEVVNTMNAPLDHSEYGCRFLGKDDE